VEITDLVSDAPRGQVLRAKLIQKYPEILNTPSIEMLLSKLPSYGGNWEQYYEIEMKWPGKSK